MDLACGRLRQLRYELNPARIFVSCEQFLHVLLSASARAANCVASAHDYGRERLDQPRVISLVTHGSFLLKKSSAMRVPDRHLR